MFILYQIGKDKYLSYLDEYYCNTKTGKLISQKDEKSIDGNNTEKNASNIKNGKGYKELAQEVALKQKQIEENKSQEDIALKIDDLNKVIFKNESSLAIDWDSSEHFLSPNGKFFIFTKLTDNRRVSIYDM